jgi:NADPH-dependent glutamate synthase beta subunit-like oxidoreductase
VILAVRPRYKIATDAPEDGRRLVVPSHGQVNSRHDVVVIGAGPASEAAADLSMGLSDGHQP